MATFQEILGKIRSKIEAADPNNMKGVSAVYQFNLSGDNGGIFHIKVEDGAGSLVESAHDDPNITITMTGDHFDDMLEEKLNAMSAFLSGKLKVNGDKALAMKLKNLIG